MRKSKMDTLLVFALTCAVVLGGWFVTRRMLILKEKEFLSGTGQIAVQSSDTALSAGNGTGQGVMQPSESALSIGSGTGQTVMQSQGNAFSAGSGHDGGVEQEVFQGKRLSEDMMAQVLTVWENSWSRRPHEPKKGQMSMEQAIDAGHNWLRAIAEWGILPADMTADDFEVTGAKLFTPEAQVDLDEELLGCWVLGLAGDGMKVSFTIHAVSGDVWQARITMEQNNGLVERGNFVGMLETAFPFIGGSDTMWVDVEENTLGQDMPEGLVYAAVKQYQIYIAAEKDVMRQSPVVMEFWVHTR